MKTLRRLPASFVADLKTFRWRRCLSIKAFAIKAGVPRTTYIGAEAGKNISAHTFLNLCAAAELDPRKYLP